MKSMVSHGGRCLRAVLLAWPSRLGLHFPGGQELTRQTISLKKKKKPLVSNVLFLSSR